MKTEQVDISKSRMKIFFPMWITAIVGWGLLSRSEQSIVGVTYMDDFDFESRYRDIHECDPMYWHPLHLPENCAKMYETLIRSKIGTSGPVRVVTKKKYPIQRPYHNSAYESESSEEEERSGDTMEIGDVGYIRQIMSEPFAYNFRPYVSKPQSPYEKMMDMLRKDVIKNPSAPIITNVPVYGPVAVYNQPISRRSETLIKKMATLYANTGPQGYSSSNNQYFGKLDITQKLDDAKEKNKQKNITRENPEMFDVNKIADKLKGQEPKISGFGHHRHRPKVIKKTLPNGDVVTVIRQ